MAVNHGVLTVNHVPHTGTYANAAARLGASGFVAGDVGKLYVQSDGRRKLWRLAATTPEWEALVPTGKNVMYVDPAGEADFALLSDALAAIAAAADAAADNQYTIIVNGVVEETDTITPLAFVHVQGLAGSKLEVTPASSGPAVKFDTITYSVWDGLEVECLGANAERAVEFAGCDTTVKLRNVVATTAGTSYRAIEVTSGDADLSGNTGTPEADYIADGGNCFGISRPGQARTYAAMVVGTTSGAVTSELLTPQGDRLVLPNLAAWVFDGWIVVRKASGMSDACGYKIAGCIRREATALSTALVGAAVITVLGETDAGYDVAVTADTTNGALKIEGVGVAGDETQWVCTVIITQVLTLAE